MTASTFKTFLWESICLPFQDLGNNPLQLKTNYSSFNSHYLLELNFILLLRCNQHWSKYITVLHCIFQGTLQKLWGTLFTGGTMVRPLEDSWQFLLQNCHPHALWSITVFLVFTWKSWKTPFAQNCMQIVFLFLSQIKKNVWSIVNLQCCYFKVYINQIFYWFSYTFCIQLYILHIFLHRFFLILLFIGYYKILFHYSFLC